MQPLHYSIISTISLFYGHLTKVNQGKDVYAKIWLLIRTLHNALRPTTPTYPPAPNSQPLLPAPPAPGTAVGTGGSNSRCGPSVLRACRPRPGGLCVVR